MMKRRRCRQRHDPRRCDQLYLLFSLTLAWNLYFSIQSATSRTTLSAFAPQPHAIDNNTLQGAYEYDKPVVTFVIPSKLGTVPTTRRRATLSRLRIPTLNDTLESLQNQTESNWQAIVAIDMLTLLLNQNTTSEFNTSNWKHYIIHQNAERRHHEDPRIQFVPILTSSRHRGSMMNGAGELRNQAIRQGQANADWIAFVDDDDTLHPRYVEYLLEGQKAKVYNDDGNRTSSSAPDIVLFRMSDPHQPQPHRRILPPFCHETAAVARNVGISFAVRKSLFFPDAGASNTTWAKHDNDKDNQSAPLSFVPAHRWEDFHFLHQAQKRRVPIVISNCITYFVRHMPEASSEFLPDWAFSKPNHNDTSVGNHQCQFRRAQVLAKSGPRLEQLCRSGLS